MKRLLLIPILLLGFGSMAQVVMTGTGSYSQDFNTLIATGTVVWADNSTLPSWYSQRVSGTGYNLVANDGASNAGNVYSYGTGTNTDRALGSVGSGGTGILAHGVAFHNTSSGSISTFTVSYTMEQWRNGGNTAAQPITWYYQISSSPITALNPGSNSGWVAVPALDASSVINTSTAGALDGNNTSNKVVKSNVVIAGLTLAAGEYLMLKWDDLNDAGSDHGLAVDDFSASWISVASCATTSTITTSACTSYTVPSSDETYFASGTYMDTIPNAAMCDSIITINLTITGPTTSTISPSACTSYMVPSGDETYFASGTYMDTIPNHLGCDSIITINLTIVSSITYYADTDTDGLGDPNNTTTACTLPGGYVTNSNDCDDTDPLIGLASTWYLDFDNDGYGSTTSTTNCTQPVGYVSNNTDCDDNNANVHPGATEIANNGIDEDCVGGDLIIAPASLGMYQFTGNTCTSAALAVTSQPANATFSDYEVSGSSLACAAGTDIINYTGWNTSSVIDPTQYYGFTLTPATCYGMNLTELHFLHRVSNTTGSPTVHIRSSLDNFATDIAAIQITTPGVNINETVNLPAATFGNVYGAVEFRFFLTSAAAATGSYRNDNVSVVGLISALPTQTFYADADGDGFGDAATSVTNCIPPAGYVTDNTDCNDNNAAEHPGATWAIDNDGDGFIGATTQVSCTQPLNYIAATAPVDCDDNDNTVHGQSVYYADTDMDGFGNLNDTVMDCSQPAGYVSNSTDCDDNDNTVGAASVQYYADADSDGYGDANNFIYACSAQTGYVSNFDDCDDTNPAVHPGATEVCDGVDNDCDNSIDEGVPTFTFYADTDNDGLGDPNNSVTDCSTPAGYVGNHSDCDDTDPTPGAGATVFYMDSDADGYGDETNSISACTAPTGYTATGGDCNDANDVIHPGATDIPANSIDENCDGVDGYLGISEMSISNLVAYPNPGTASVTVTFNGSMENTSVRFLGVDGKAVNIGKTEVSASGIVISTLNLVPGVYFIEVSQGDAVQTVRWVKQ